MMDHEDSCRKQAKQMAEGLKYMAKRGYAHLDFKPNNILCDEKGDNIWIMDFGQTKKLELDEDKNTKIFRKGRREGGTPAYNSPEVCL